MVFQSSFCVDLSSETAKSNFFETNQRERTITSLGLNMHASKDHNGHSETCKSLKYLPP